MLHLVSRKYHSKKVNDVFSSGLLQAAVLKLYESDRAAAWKQRTTSSTLNIVLLAFLFFYSFKVLLVKRHIHNRLFFFFLFKCMLYYDHWNLLFNSPIYLSVVWQKHERKFPKCISLPGVSLLLFLYKQVRPSFCLKHF